MNPNQVTPARRRIWEAGIVAVSAAAVAVVFAFVPSTSGISGLDGQYANGTVQAARVRVGRSSVFQTYLANKSGAPIILESARLLPLKGFKTPRLRSTAVQITVGDVAAGQHWHPGIPDHKLHGFALRTGGYAPINYYLYDARAGKYAAAGLTLLVRQGDTTQTVDSVSGAALCVYAHRVPRHTRGCSRLGHRVLDRVNGL